MHSRWLWVLLVLSIAFNLFFAGGWAYLKLTDHDHRHWSQARYEDFIKDFALTPEQVADLKAMREETRENFTALRATWKERNRAFAALMAEPTLDREELQQVIAEGSAQWRSAFADMAERMHAFIWSLPPEQRQAVLEKAEDGRFMKMLWSSGRKSDRDRD